MRDLLIVMLIWCTILSPTPEMYTLSWFYGLFTLVLSVGYYVIRLIHHIKNT